MANDSDIRPGDGHVHEEAERKTPAGDGRVSGADGEVRAEHGARRQPPLRLPFDGRREDAGSWAYDHRVGLCVTIIAYLVFGIVFVGAKITLNGRSHQQGIIVDLQSLEALQRERDRLEEEVRRKSQENFDWRSIRNLSSNENALNENLKDDRGTDASALNETADEAERRMRANRDAYERGVAEARAIRERKDELKERDPKEENRRVKGRVTVSFSFVNPLRYSRRLIKPAYRCEGGGEVVVETVIDQNGEVISAQVLSGGDECMRRTALDAARNSLFDINESAPPRQRGTITYIFIPQ